MKKIGVKYLNLHQLLFTEYNYRDFIKRNYTFLHNEAFSILESEITALKLLEFAIRNKVEMPINYCSQYYKRRFQTSAENRWKAKVFIEEYEGLTESNLIRRLSVRSSKKRHTELTNKLKTIYSASNLWSENKPAEEIFIHSSLAKHIKFTDGDALNIRYFNVKFRKPLECLKIDDRSINIGSRQKVYLYRDNIFNKTIDEPVGIAGFIALFIDKTDEKKALQELFSDNHISIKKWKQICAALLSLKQWEQIEAGLPELF